MPELDVINEQLGPCLLDFFVPGEAMTAGSKTPVRRKDGGIALRHDSKGTASWMAQVREAAAKAAEKQIKGAPTFTVSLDDPAWLWLTFHRMRPRSHYGTGRNAGILKLSAPPYPATGRDLTKLLRAVEDSLQQVGVLSNDSRICVQVTEKRWTEGTRPGVRVRLGALWQPIRRKT